ncbi:hypothetical protein D3C71_1545280 [compost metagenome]
MLGEIDHRNIQHRPFAARGGRADAAIADEDFAGIGGETCSVFVVRTDQAADAVDLGLPKAELGRGRFKGRADIGIWPHRA